MVILAITSIAIIISSVISIICLYDGDGTPTVKVYSLISSVFMFVICIGSDDMSPVHPLVFGGIMLVFLFRSMGYNTAPSTGVPVSAEIVKLVNIRRYGASLWYSIICAVFYIFVTTIGSQ